MSIATVVTRGYGTFGSVNLLPVRGYSIGSPIVGGGRNYSPRGYQQGSQNAAGFAQGSMMAVGYQQGSMDAIGYTQGTTNPFGYTQGSQ